MAIEPAIDYRFVSLERRVDRIEEVHPEVLADRVAQLAERVDTLIKVGISVLVALVGAAISFAFMAATL